MDRFARLVDNTTNVEKQECLRELGKLVGNLQSTSKNDSIKSDRNMRKFNLQHTEMLTTILNRDGTVDECESPDVSIKIDCLLDLWKLKETTLNGDQTDEDSEDEVVVPLSEIAEISARHFVSFGIQLIAASCAGDLSWMKALLRVGANPNETIVNDTRYKALTAFRGCLDHAPEETRVKCLKLLMANRCKQGPNDIFGWYSLGQLVEMDCIDILEWFNISDDGHRNIKTSLHAAARTCDYDQMKQILKAAWDEKNSRLHRRIRFISVSVLNACVRGFPHIEDDEDGGANNEAGAVMKTKAQITKRKRQCIKLLLSYGISTHQNHFNYLAGLARSNHRLTVEPPASSCIFNLIYVAGMTGLNDWLPLISFARKSDSWDIERNSDALLDYMTYQDKVQEYYKYKKASNLWEYLKTHENLEQICNKHYAICEGTVPMKLMEMCRDSVRNHLTKVGRQNLFVVIPQLPLPSAIKAYLLYHETLETDDHECTEKCATGWGSHMFW